MIMSTLILYNIIFRNSEISKIPVCKKLIHYFSPKYLSASIAAIHPEPAAVTA